jgi:hypothetical protein
LYNELKRLSGDSRKIESLPAVVNNNLIQQLKTRYVQLTGEYSDLSQKFGSEHPRIVRLKSEISEVKDKIAQEIKNIAGSIEVEYKVSKAKEESIARALEDQKQTALRLNQKEIQYNVLNRDVETNRTLYQSLLTRAKETSVTEELKVSNIMIVDQARVPDRPVKPRKTLNILLAVITGLTLGIGLAFFFEYLDNNVISLLKVYGHKVVPLSVPLESPFGSFQIGLGLFYTVINPAQSLSGGIELSLQILFDIEFAVCIDDSGDKLWVMSLETYIYQTAISYRRYLEFSQIAIYQIIHFLVCGHTVFIKLLRRGRQRLFLFRFEFYRILEVQGLYYPQRQ